MTGCWARPHRRWTACPASTSSVELITHRFTPGSKAVLNDWYKESRLDMDEAKRTRKTTKFGSLKYAYPPELMRAMRGALERSVAARLPEARILYWT